MDDKGEPGTSGQTVRQVTPIAWKHVIGKDGKNHIFMDISALEGYDPEAGLDICPFPLTAEQIAKL